VFWKSDECPEIPHPYRNKRLSEQVVAWQQVVYSGNETPGHPIWPTSERMIITDMRLQRQNNGNVVPFSWLPWRVFAGDMMETRGAILFMENGNRLRVFNYEMDDIDWWHHAEDERKFEELKQRFQVR